MIGIIGAMQIEIDKLVDRMANAETILISGIVFHRGKLNGVPTVVAVSGVGKVFAALCAQTMILRFGVSKIINTGVAGGIAPDVMLGDFVIASGLCQHDMDTSGVGDPKGLISGVNKVFFDTDPGMLRETLAASAELNYRAEAGIIASGDQFVCDRSRKTWIHEYFKASAVEMEGAAIAQVCFVNSIPFLVIRAISDDASGHAPTSYQQFAKEAAQRSATLTLKVIPKL